MPGRRIERSRVALLAAAALALCLIPTVAVASFQAGGGAARKKRSKRCRRGRIRVFVRGGRRHSAVFPKSPRQRPPKHWRVACVRALKGGLTPKPLASRMGADIARTFAALPRRIRKKARRLKPMTKRLVQWLEGRERARQSSAGRSRPPKPRAHATAEQNVDYKDGDTTGHASANRTPIDDGEHDGSELRIKMDAEQQKAADQKVSTSSTGLTRVVNDKCPTAEGQLGHGSFTSQVSTRTTATAGKAKGAVTVDDDAKATYEAKVGDDGEPTELKLKIEGEHRFHKAVAGDYDYYRVKFSSDVNVSLPGGAFEYTSGGWQWFGNVGADQARETALQSIRDAAGEMADNVEHRRWQQNRECAQLEVTADKSIAPTGGQIGLTLKAHAHDGKPLSTVVNVGRVLSCPGTLSQDKAQTGPDGEANVTLSDPGSEWVAPRNACVYSTIQSRAGKADAGKTIPSEPALNKVSGSLSFSGHNDDVCGPGDISASANVNETDDPGAEHSSETHNTGHGTQASFQASWSDPSGACGNTSGSGSGNVNGFDPNTPYGNGTWADFNWSGNGTTSFHDPPLVRVWISIPGSATEASDCAGAHSGEVQVIITVTVAPPSGGRGTVHIDRQLSYSNGTNYEDDWQIFAKGDFRACSSFNQNANPKLHVTGDLFVRKIG